MTKIRRRVYPECWAVDCSFVGLQSNHWGDDMGSPGSLHSAGI